MNYKYLKNRVKFFALLLKTNVLINKEVHGASSEEVEKVNKRIDKVTIFTFKKIRNMQKEDKNKVHKT